MVMTVIWRRLCVRDLMMADLLFLCWARVRRVRRGNTSSELLMCGAGVRSILLLPIVARCLETIDVYIYGACLFYACCSDCGNVCCSSRS